MKPGDYEIEPDYRLRIPIFSWETEDLAVEVLNGLYWDAEGNWGVRDEVLS